MQAALDTFGLRPFQGAESVTAIMETSYRHATLWQQAMFLDAALLLDGDPAANLVGLWTALIMRECSSTALTAEGRAEEELARLIDFSLVSCDNNCRCAQPMYQHLACTSMTLNAPQSPGAQHAGADQDSLLGMPNTSGTAARAQLAFRNS